LLSSKRFILSLALDLYTGVELDEIMDEVAERARALGGRAAGSMAEFLKHARLKESTSNIDAKTMIAELVGDHETLIRARREDAAATGDKYGDAGTEDFLVGLMEQHERRRLMRLRGTQ